MTPPRKPRRTARKSASKKPLARKTAAKKAPKKPTKKTATKPARKSPAKKPASRTTAKKVAARKAPAKAPAKTKTASRPARKPKPKLTAAQRTLALVEKLLDEHQADDVAVVDLAGKTAMADYMVVASGRNPRHIGAMADHLKMRLKSTSGRTPPIEGLGSADWVLVDAGDVIVHLFRPEVRDLYNLEKMWGPDWSGEPAEE